MNIQFHYEKNQKWAIENGYLNGVNLLILHGPKMSGDTYQAIRKNQDSNYPVFDIHPDKSLTVYFPIYTHDEIWASED